MFWFIKQTLKTYNMLMSLTDDEFYAYEDIKM